ncbi:hypothetical protein [Syntrophomonas curvata]
MIIVEIDQTGTESNIAVWPFEECGEYVAGVKNKQVFMPDVVRALAFPFILPSGGNPLKPQGRYPVPSYLVYDAQFKDFEKSPEAIAKFINGRISRTMEINLAEKEITSIASSLNAILKQKDFSSQGKKLGLLVLAVIDAKGSPYIYVKKGYEINALLPIGRSRLYADKDIVADAERILQYYWSSTFQEGAVCGKKNQGICSICHSSTEVVSGYNKSLSWLPTTWGGPLSFGNDQKLVESISLCKECYGDLTVGASLFGRLSKLVDASLLKEIFSPVISTSAKNKSRKIQDNIYGSMIALPLWDEILKDEDSRDDWVSVLYESLDESRSIGKKKSHAFLHIKNLTGFIAKVPEEWISEDFRLNLLYYSGDPGKLDIHLRAIIEDILPSTAQELQDYLENIAGEADDVMAEYTFLGEQTIQWEKEKLQSLPYMLASAFGASYVWTSMQKAFKRQYIDDRPFVKNYAIRMNREAKLLPDSIFNLQKEGVEYYAIKSFLHRYNSELAGQRSENDMKNVKELIALTWDVPVEELAFDNIDELGFAAGQVTKHFGNIYYYHYNKNNKDKTKESSMDKDFIKHRVMTFGSTLTPDVIRYRALSKMEEYNKKLNLKVPDDTLGRAAVISMNFMNFDNEIKRNRDRFMAAFWAGYSLRKKPKKDSDTNDKQTESEGGNINE